MSYAKLYSTILDSSIWSASDSTRLVWITMLAMATKNGLVHASVDGLARRANVPLEKVREALRELTSPDPNDKSGVLNGRRIVPMQGCWQLVNFEFYRETRSIDAVRKQQWRERTTMSRKASVQDVLERPTSSRSAPAPAPAPAPEAATEEGGCKGDAPAVPPAADAAPQRKRTAKPRSVKRLLPDDFAPTAEHATIARESGADLTLEFTKMRDWAAENAVRKADWNATLRNWLRRSGPSRNVGTNRVVTDDRHQRQADRVRMLREQEAEEERRSK